MNALRRFSFAFVFLALTLSIHADCANFLPSGPVFLIPLHVSSVRGANGSIWSSELAIYNGSQQTVRLVDSCALSGCNFFEVAPDEVTTRPASSAIDFPGYFVGTGTQDPAPLVFHDRVYDETQAGSNWGAYVPVVRWDVLQPRTLTFINVPNLESARHTLRVYAAVGGVPVVVRYIDRDGQVLTSIEATLNGSECTSGYLQLGAPTGVADSPTMRIEVTSHRAEITLWGMVSITDATSRQITIFPSN